MISVTTPTVENGVIVEYKGIVTGQVVNGVNAYNVEPEYNGNALTARDKSTIQGYFSK